VDVPPDLTDGEFQWLKENLHDADVDWDIEVDGEICDPEWDDYEITDGGLPTHCLIRDEDGKLRILNVEEDQ
jgi:hypothetical protein